MVSRTELEVEEGGRASFTIHLDADPGGDCTVSVAASGVGLGVWGDGYQFRPGTWAVPFEVVVLAEKGSPGGSVTLSAPGLDVVTIPVTVVRPHPIELEVEPRSLTLREGGSTTITVSPGARPQVEVVVSVRAFDPGAMSVSPDTLTFSPDSSWPRQVTLTALDDDDARDEVTTVLLTGPDSQPEVVDVAIDDDYHVGISAPGTLLVGEQSSASLSVRLSAQPQQPVTVAVEIDDRAPISVTPATLVFTPDDWSTPQEVTVMGLDDADRRANNTTITLTSDFDRVTVEVRVTDDD